MRFQNNSNPFRNRLWWVLLILFWCLVGKLRSNRKVSDRLQHYLSYFKGYKQSGGAKAGVYRKQSAENPDLWGGTFHLCKSLSEGGKPKGQAKKQLDLR